MAFTDYPLDTGRTNLTSAPDRHPLDHNQERAALNHLQGQVDANLASANAGDAAVQANLDARVSSVFTPYTPTITGVTLGSGGYVNGYWSRAGPYIFTYGIWVLSTSGTVSPVSAIGVTLPFPAHSSMFGWRAAEASFHIPGTIGVMSVRTEIGSGGTIAFLGLNSGTGGYIHDWIYIGNPGHPVSAPWGANSAMHWRLTYRPA